MLACLCSTPASVLCSLTAWEGASCRCRVELSTCSWVAWLILLFRASPSLLAASSGFPAHGTPHWHAAALVTVPRLQLRTISVKSIEIETSDCSGEGDCRDPGQDSKGDMKASLVTAVEELAGGAEDWQVSCICYCSRRLGPGLAKAWPRLGPGSAQTRQTGLRLPGSQGLLQKTAVSLGARPVLTTAQWILGEAIDLLLQTAGPLGVQEGVRDVLSSVLL